MSHVWRYHRLLTVAGCFFPFFVSAQSLDALLQALNQSSTEVVSYPVDRDQDLVALNLQEVRQITHDWEVSAQDSVANSKRDKRDRKNRFFHTAVSKLNAPLSSWIKSSSLGAVDRRSVAQRVLAQALKHPIASIENTRFRKRSGEIGYCFGRALLVHYELLKAGIPQQDLVKFFALGELTVEKQHWRFHAAMGVRDPKEGILIVDPLFPEVRGVEEWMSEVAAYDIKRPLSRVRFYPTDPRKFLPSFGAYQKHQLTHSLVREYFMALAGSL